MKKSWHFWRQMRTREIDGNKLMPCQGVYYRAFRRKISGSSHSDIRVFLGFSRECYIIPSKLLGNKNYIDSRSSAGQKVYERITIIF